jgi:hypothetical protein
MGEREDQRHPGARHRLRTVAIASRMPFAERVDVDAVVADSEPGDQASRF